MKDALRNLTETVFAYVDIKAVLALTIFGAPVVMLFVKGGQIVQAAQ